MKQRLLIVTLSLAALAAAAPASAQLTPPPPTTPGQQRPERPNQALFGGGYGNLSQRLVLTTSLGAGYDEDMLKGKPESILTPVTAAPPRSGLFSLASTNLTYTVGTSRVAGSLSAGAYGRYYTGMTDPLVGTYSGGGQLAFKLAERSSLSVNVSGGLYQQNAAAFSGTGMGGGLGNMPGLSTDPTAFANGDTYKGLQSGVQFNQYVTKRLALNAGYNYYANDAWRATGSGRYATQTARAGVSYDVAKGLSLRLGYAAGDNAYGTPDSAQTPFRQRSIDGGINFDRSLSLTRRSTVSFGTGVSGFSNQNQNLNTRYYATGHVNFNYEIGRSWTASAGYQRTADLSQTFGQPVIGDSVNAGVGGMISRRVQLNTSVGVFRGDVGITSGAPGYTAGSAGIGLQFGLTRELALGVGYTYYKYQFDSGVPLPPGMLSRMERQSVRVSLDLWAPLMMRARRPNAAR